MDSLSELARLAKSATAGGSRWVGGSEVWNMDVKHERTNLVRSSILTNPTDLCHDPIPSHPSSRIQRRGQLPARRAAEPLIMGGLSQPWTTQTPAP